MNQEIRFDNYSMFVESKHNYDWYDWCVFVNEEREIIEKINSVEYILHPTFPNPIRIVRDKDHCFSLLSSGWGTFKIKIKVHMEDGSVVDRDHYLILAQDNWPRKSAPDSFGNDETERVYRGLSDKKYRWRQVKTLSKLANIPDTQVLRILENLEKDEFVRKAPYKTIQGTDLWGATAIVGILPRR
ncbi:MAG: pYEATS domain-containing protein [Candidatus Hodarchaeota archaeon]